LFRLLFAAADGRLVWDAALPIAATVRSMAGRSHASTRLLLDPCRPTIQRFTANAAEACATAARLFTREQVGVSLRRERALIDDISERHGRLSADLLQLGLFDRRHERLAAAQAALLEHALSASHARVAELAAYEHLQLDSCDLVFAVAVDGLLAARDAVDCW
jgi:hypothetical protein